jgi:hypothetical protein
MNRSGEVTVRGGFTGVAFDPIVLRFIIPVIHFDPRIPFRKASPYPGLF